MTTRTLDSSDIMTAKEVMDLLRIKRTTLWKMQRAGLLTVYGYSKNHYYLRDEVENLVLQPKDINHSHNTEY